MPRNDISTAIRYSAYAGLMFFSLLVEKRLESDFKDFDPEEKDFLRGRCKVGNFILAGLVIFGILFAFGSYLERDRMLQIAGVIAGVLIVVELGGIMMVSWGISMVLTPFYLPEDQRSSFLKFRIPGYIEKYRNLQSDLQKSNRWLKESQLWWFLVMLCLLLLPFWQVGGGVLLGGGIRLGLLLWRRDIIPNTLKIRLNRLYYFLVEEFFLVPYLKFQALFSSQSDAGLLEPLQQAQKQTANTGFFLSYNRKVLWGTALVSVGVLGCWIGGMRWKFIPLLWWGMRWVILKSHKNIE